MANTGVKGTIAFVVHMYVPEWATLTGMLLIVIQLPRSQILDV